MSSVSGPSSVSTASHSTPNSTTPSAARSTTESSSAPAADAFPLMRATAPSIESSPPDTMSMTPPQRSWSIAMRYAVTPASASPSNVTAFGPMCSQMSVRAMGCS